MPVNKGTEDTAKETKISNNHKRRNEFCFKKKNLNNVFLWNFFHTLKLALNKSGLQFVNNEQGINKLQPNFGSKFCLKGDGIRWHTILSVCHYSVCQCTRNLSFTGKIFSILKNILDVFVFDILNQGFKFIPQVSIVATALNSLMILIELGLLLVLAVASLYFSTLLFTVF